MPQMQVKMSQGATPPPAHPQTTWGADDVLAKLIAVLPKATTDEQHSALEALQAGRYSQCKIYPCLALDDPFVKAIGYMSSIPTVISKGVPTLPTLIGESCRAIADACYGQALLDNQSEDTALTIKQDATATLHQINQDIFAKGLGK